MKKAAIVFVLAILVLVGLLQPKSTQAIEGISSFGICDDPDRERFYGLEQPCGECDYLAGFPDDPTEQVADLDGDGIDDTRLLWEFHCCRSGYAEHLLISYAMVIFGSDGHYEDQWWCQRG